MEYHMKGRSQGNSPWAPLFRKESWVLCQITYAQATCHKDSSQCLRKMIPLLHQTFLLHFPNYWCILYSKIFVEQPVPVEPGQCAEHFMSVLL